MIGDWIAHSEAEEDIEGVAKRGDATISRQSFRWILDAAFIESDISIASGKNSDKSVFRAKMLIGWDPQKKMFHWWFSRPIVGQAEWTHTGNKWTIQALPDDEGPGGAWVIEKVGEDIYATQRTHKNGKPVSRPKIEHKRVTSGR